MKTVKMTIFYILDSGQQTAEIEVQLSKVMGTRAES